MKHSLYDKHGTIECKLRYNEVVAFGEAGMSQNGDLFRQLHCLVVLRHICNTNKWHNYLSIAIVELNNIMEVVKEGIQGWTGHVGRLKDNIYGL